MFAVAATTAQPLWSDRMVWESSPVTMKRSKAAVEDETSLLLESESDRKRRRTLAMACLPAPGNGLLSSHFNMQKETTLSMQSIRSTSVGSSGSHASSSSTTPAPAGAHASSSPTSFSALELDTLRRLSKSATNPSMSNGLGSHNKTTYNHASNLSRLLLASSHPPQQFDAATAAASATLSSLGIESQNTYNAARPFNSTRFLPSLRGGDALSMQRNLSHQGATAADLQQRQRIDELLRSASSSSSTPASSYGGGYLSRSISDNLPSSMHEISSLAAAAATARNPMASREEELLHQLRRVHGGSLIGSGGGWNRWPSDRSSLMASMDNATIESLRNSILQQRRLHSSGMPGTPPGMSSSSGSSLPTSALHGPSGTPPAPAAHSYAHLFGPGTATHPSHLPRPQDLSMAGFGSSSETRLGLASAFGLTERYLSTVGDGPFGMKGGQPVTELKRASSAPAAAAKKSQPSAQKPPSPAGRFIPTVMRTSSATSKSLLERLPFPKSPQQPIPNFQERPFVPLSTDEDQNWLSDLLCFVRSELVEVFRATEDDVRQRNSSKRVRLGQVGLRCRFCAHLAQGSKVGRSSSFPSSLDRIYQSLTMMLRDHFARCTAMPASHQQRFIELKRRTTQGATDSKQYWIHAARKMGLEDTIEGIWVCRPTASSSDTTSVSSSHGDSGKPTEEQVSKLTTSSSGESLKPQDSGEDLDTKAQETSNTSSATSMSGISLVSPKDEDAMSPYMYLLLSNIRLVHMEKSEQTGNRKSLPAGLPGLGCAHCCQSDRRGLCRIFPSRRRTLIHKIDDLYQHFLKCTVCPTNVKEQLVTLHDTDVQNNTSSTQSKKDRIFVEELWTRMGHGTTVQET